MIIGYLNPTWRSVVLRPYLVTVVISSNLIISSITTVALDIIEF